MPWLSLPSFLMSRSFLPAASWEGEANESLSAGERPICFRSERPVLPRLGPGLRTVPGIQVGCGRLIGPEPSPRSRHLFDLTSVYHNRGASFCRPPTRRPVTRAFGVQSVGGVSRAMTLISCFDSADRGPQSRGGGCHVPIRFPS